MFVLHSISNPGDTEFDAIQGYKHSFIFWPVTRYPSFFSLTREFSLHRIFIIKYKIVFFVIGTSSTFTVFTLISSSYKTIVIVLLWRLSLYFVCPSLCLFIFFVWLSVCLFVCLSVFLIFQSVPSYGQIVLVKLGKDHII